MLSTVPWVTCASRVCSSLLAEDVDRTGEALHMDEGQEQKGRVLFPTK